MLLSSINDGQVSELNFSYRTMLSIKPKTIKFLIGLLVLASAFANFFQARKTAAQSFYNLGLPASRCIEIKEKNISEYKIASDNKDIFVSFTNGKLVSYNLSHGNTNWISELGGEIVSEALLEESKLENEILFVTTRAFPTSKNFNLSKNAESKNTNLRAISTVTGLTIWQTEIKAAGKVYLYNYHDKLIFVGENGNAGSLNKENGQVLWENFLDNSLSAPPFFSGEVLAIALANRKVVFLSIENAAEISRLEVNSLITSLFFANNKLFLGDERGAVHAYLLNKEKKKKLWIFQNGGAISSLHSTSDGIFVTSYDNFISMLSSNKGKRLWKKRLSGRITIKPTIEGKFAAVTSVENTELSILELSSGKKVNQFFLGGENFLLSSPILTNDMFVLSTLNGVYVFSNENESGKCNGEILKNRP